MRHGPILMQGEMVRAILRPENPKTNTRRICKYQPPEGYDIEGYYWNLHNHTFHVRFRNGKDIYSFKCPYGGPEDRLWVREAIYIEPGTTPENWDRELEDVRYKADGGELLNGPDDWGRWTPSIHMPRWASRIDLEIMEVRVERLQDINEADALAEGVFKSTHDNYFHSTIHPIKGTYQCWISARQAFEMLWKSINGPDSWAANPWVWVISFKRLKP